MTIALADVVCCLWRRCTVCFFSCFHASLLLERWMEHKVQMLIMELGIGGPAMTFIHRYRIVFRRHSRIVFNLKFIYGQFHNILRTKQLWRRNEYNSLSRISNASVFFPVYKLDRSTNNKTHFVFHHIFNINNFYCYYKHKQYTFCSSFSDSYFFCCSFPYNNQIFTFTVDIILMKTIMGIFSSVHFFK